MTARSSTGTADVHRLDSGVIVVDYGTTWYRQNLDSSITRKDARNGGVKSRAASPAEVKKINKLIAEAGL
jgi:hypothetical protein